MILIFVSALAVLPWAVAASYGPSDAASFREACLGFNATSFLTNSTLRLHEYVPANTTIPLDGMDPTCARTAQLFAVEACRVALTVPTTNRSSVIVEVFLPRNDAWTGRYLATGNGGIDGCIRYEDIAYGLSNGFATTGSNNGHNGTGGQDFLNNEDIIIDFSWRALHTSATTGKTLEKAFYGKDLGKSYYMGCSGGGRQGVQAAYLVPQYYDGILAGSPALNFNYMSAWRASFFVITGAANSSSFIAAETWQGLIHNEVLAQCDALDGVADGILTNPSLCLAVFRPETLLCNAASPTKCLSPAQVDVVRRVFTPLTGTAGQTIYPALSPGAENVATQRLLSGTPFSYSVDWFRYAVYSNPTWDPSSSIADADAAQAANPGNAETWPADLSAFRDAGGKLLLYHGGADQQITHFDTQRWYDFLARGMSASAGELDAWMRFFFVPGMNHCSGGPGAWQIGQSGAAAAGIGYEAGSNVLAALVEWVEGGSAPESMLGTKFVNDSVGAGVAFRREHCRYPLRSVHLGGEVEEVGSWVCK